MRKTRFFMHLSIDGRVDIIEMVVTDENDFRIKGHIPGCPNSEIMIEKPYLTFDTLDELKAFYRKSFE